MSVVPKVKLKIEAIDENFTDRKALFNYKFFHIVAKTFDSMCCPYSLFILFSGMKYRRIVDKL